MTDQHTRTFQFAGLAILIALPALVLFPWWMLHKVRAEPTAREMLFVPVARNNVGDLFRIEWEPATQGWKIETDSVVPASLDGAPEKALVDRSTKRLLVGDYVLDIAAFHKPSGGSTVEWVLAGVRVDIGDEVGRSPAFYDSGRLQYEPWKDEYANVRGRKLPLWVDSLPIRAFLVRPLADCGGEQYEACIEIRGGKGRVTLEISGSQRSFRHLDVGDVIGIPLSSRLWFGHVPFGFLKLASGWIVQMPDAATEPGGERWFLGSMSASGSASVPDDATPVRVRNINALVKKEALPESRWSPELEDEYQLMIDEELLCVAFREVNGSMAPQLIWRAPAERGCEDLVEGTATDLNPALDARVLEIYRRRRAEDMLVQRSNEVLARGSFDQGADSLPFVFEWWISHNGSRIEALPLRLWGIRTQATSTRLTPSPVGSNMPKDAPIVVTDDRGTRLTLASTADRNRRYVSGSDLLGLGPLLGVRRAVDGLDEILPGVVKEHKLKEVELTIDADLQRGLWSAFRNSKILNTALRSVSAAKGLRRVWGVTAVALDPETGDLLAVLNWPEGLDWEDPQAFERLRSIALGGRTGPSLNRAMLRDDKVGSTFKMLAIYAMADAGVLDGVGLEWKERSQDPFILLQTDARGRVLKPIPSRSTHDGRVAPLPIGASGISGGLNAATGQSSNTFFSFVSTMLLGGQVPDVQFSARCPVALDLRRTDAPAPGSEWVICRANTRLSGALGVRSESGTPPQTTILLLPPGESLSARVASSFRTPSGVGYFRSALNAGFTFLRNPAYHLAGESMETYESVPRWASWFLAIPEGEGRVFGYPAIFSPGSYFGGTERFNGQAVASSRSLYWRDFASQAIGEGGRGSALSLAVLYSAALRKDGMFVAPRLIRNARLQPGLSPAYKPDAKNARHDTILEALAQPLGQNGTAEQLGIAAAREGLPLRGKTGTFGLGQRVRSIAADGFDATFVPCGALYRRGGVVERAVSPSWGVLLGTRFCENEGKVITAVHRYPERAPSEPPIPTVRGAAVDERFSSFVGLLKPDADGGRPLIIALISDVDGLAAQTVMAEMLPELKRWFRRAVRP